MERYQDYRFCVKLSMQIMREQREKLCHDSIEHDVTLYTALHETNDSTRALRFQYYVVKWFDEHWNALCVLLERHPEYTIDQKKQMTLFFSSYFSKLLNKLGTTETLANLCIPDLLTLRKAILNELIAVSDKWEKNSDKLRLQMKKHEEQYIAMIQSREKDKTGG